MEYCDDSLVNIVKEDMNEKEVLKIIKDISKALDYIHNQKIVHLDIKPDNILRRNGIYKLTDLGLARSSYNLNSEDIEEGDCRYLAQEVLTE